MIKFRIELGLAGVFVILAVLATIWPTWIESIFEVSPDGGTGTSEWWMVAAFGLLAVVAAALSWREYIAQRAISGGSNSSGL